MLLGHVDALKIEQWVEHAGWSVVSEICRIPVGGACCLVSMVLDEVPGGGS